MAEAMATLLFRSSISTTRAPITRISIPKEKLLPSCQLQNRAIGRNPFPQPAANNRPRAKITHKNPKAMASPSMVTVKSSGAASCK